LQHDLRRCKNNPRKLLKGFLLVAVVLIILHAGLSLAWAGTAPLFAKVATVQLVWAGWRTSVSELQARTYSADAMKEYIMQTAGGRSVVGWAKEGGALSLVQNSFDRHLVVLPPNVQGQHHHPVVVSSMLDVSGSGEAAYILKRVAGAHILLTSAGSAREKRGGWLKEHTCCYR
jgi:hypothetical protein